MIDDRYSVEAFRTLGIDSAAARRLADDLADEIAAELHAMVERALAEMTQVLNGLGHRLEPYGAQAIGAAAYRDVSGRDEGEPCRLRVAVDTIISTGYAHLIPVEEA